MFISFEENVWYSYDFGWFLWQFSMILADFKLPGSGSGWPKTKRTDPDPQHWFEHNKAVKCASTMYNTLLSVRDAMFTRINGRVDYNEASAPKNTRICHMSSRVPPRFHPQRCPLKPFWNLKQYNNNIHQFSQESSFHSSNITIMRAYTITKGQKCLKSQSS